MNSAEVNNWGAMYLLELWFSLDVCSGVGLLDHMVALFLIFKEPPHCSPHWLHQFTFPSPAWEGSLSPHPFQHLLSVDFFDDGHSDCCELILIVVLICIRLVITDVECLFMCFIAVCMSSLEKCLFRSSAHFFGLGYLLE